jgi:dephospho-CoA kinase
VKKLIFILGASGSGKTTTVKKIEAKHRDEYYFCYFDQPRVPSEEEMKEKYGSWEVWGIERTNEWIKQIKENYIENRVTIFDVHTHPINIENACKEFGITDYAIILLDCSDDERKRRLIQRGQPELITASLPTWAQLLRDEGIKRNLYYINNTGLAPEEGFRKVETKIGEILKN